MSSDAYRKSGRGGAGNFFSAEDGQADPDIVPTTAQSPASSAARADVPGIRTGRGGAGNFHTETISDAQSDKDGAAPTSVLTTPKLAGTGMGGRGGAGNWVQEPAKDDEEEKAKQSEVDSRVVRDVDAELPVPPRTYRSHSRERKGQESL